VPRKGMVNDSILNLTRSKPRYGPNRYAFTVKILSAGTIRSLLSIQRDFSRKRAAVHEWLMIERAERL
jgi:hypothetical protein